MSLTSINNQYKNNLINNVNAFIRSNVVNGTMSAENADELCGLISQSQIILMHYS